MKLHTNPASPFCRKVEVVMLETGQREGVEDIFAVGSAVDPSRMPTHINPLGKIPVLVPDEGPAIYDSRVICQYLSERAGATLYPRARLWEVLTLEALGDGISDAAVLMVYEGRTRPEEKRHSPWVEGQWAKIERSLDVLENEWMAVLSGPLNAGQISVACALAYLDFRHGDRDWRPGRDKLATWHAAFAQRDAMQATKPDR